MDKNGQRSHEIIVLPQVYQKRARSVKKQSLSICTYSLCCDSITVEQENVAFMSAFQTRDTQYTLYICFIRGRKNEICSTPLFTSQNAKTYLKEKTTKFDYIL